MLACDVKERDAPVVVAVTSITLILTEGDNLGISYVSSYCTFMPTLAENIMEL